ncbi:MAG: DUF1849 family protein [Pseudomonadota bacterium]|nr:DUF1849 family protein [Pseudomonadota bacterium]
MAILSFVPATAGAGFSPHRAVYDLQRLPGSDSTAFAQVSGRMVYQYDETCEGMTYSHRMLLNLVTQQGESITSETVVSFFETLDGKTLRFSVRESNEGIVTSVREGSVRRTAPSVPADITFDRLEGGGEDTISKLPAGVMFPIGHSVDLTRAAEAGQAAHHATTFDGDSLSVVDSFIRSDTGSVEKAVPAEMKGMKAWIARVAFYHPDSPDSAPYYETQMRLFANGLSGDFTMETGDLKAIARLVEVELHEKPSC